ncbi:MULTISPECIES: GPP34 family phosphoprotein [unclassified Streptomyces]|uniref:GPP34 family phosphoprotein n=1 Tax=unclassified Streptomyces TaxID=2593676 RepID=UPI0036F4E6F8
MTTARDLALVVLGRPADRPVEQGDLSLVLAGAEAIDLLEIGTLTLDGDRVVPGPRVATGDRLLDEAAASLAGHGPHETIEDWLWRRGRNLAAAYVDDLHRTGLFTRPRRHGLRFWAGQSLLADSPERARAEERRASGERVLHALMGAAGMGGAPEEAREAPTGDAITKVLAAAGDAVTHLEALRLRRDVESAAFDNVWRG